MTEVVPAYWCSLCQSVSVAERQEDGSISCPNCDDTEKATNAADEIEGIRSDIRMLSQRSKGEQS